MKLMTKELEQRFRQVGSQRGSSDPIVIAKFFYPFSAATWYAIEYSPDERVFYGWVDMFNDPNCAELGDFSLDELESINIKGVRIERDKFFREKPLSKVLTERYKYNPLEEMP